MADSELQTAEGRLDTCPVPRSPMQTSGLMESPRSVGSPRYLRTPIQTSGLMDSPRSVGSPRSLRGSIQASGLMDSPRSAGSPRSLQSPRFLASPNFGKPPQLHAEMCANLAALVKRMHTLGPSLDSERGRFRKAGIQAICALQLALDKARSLLQYCSDSSKLYLAIKGESMLTRFEEVKEGLETSLRRIAVLVSQDLASQISDLQGELSRTRFQLDPAEKQIGADIISLLLQKQKGPQYENPEAEEETFSQVAIRLGLLTADAVLAEKRALKRLLEKARYEEDRRKESVTLHILQLMKKYNNVLRTENIMQTNGDLSRWLVSDRGWGSGKLSASVDSETDRTASPGSHQHCVDCRCSEMAFLESVDRLEDPDCLSPRTPRTPRTPHTPRTPQTPVAPEELRCPISLQLMSEPVIVASGQTYERVCIEKWFKEGHVTCPKTRQGLAHLNLTPNYCVKGLIASWCDAHNIPVPGPPSPPPSPVSWRWEVGSASELVKVRSGEQGKDARVVPVDDLPEEDINTPRKQEPEKVLEVDSSQNANEQEGTQAPEDTLMDESGPSQIVSSGVVRSLELLPEDQWAIRCEDLVAGLSEGSLQQKYQAAEEIRVLAKTNAKARTQFGEGGAIPALVELLSTAVDSDDQSAQEMVTISLLNVAISDDKNKAGVVAAGCVPLLVELLKAGASRACKEAAVAALLTLSCLNENKACIGSSGAIPLLVQLLISGSNQGRKDALTTLYNLTILLGNRPRVVRAGAIPILVHLLSLRKVDLLEKIVALLYILASIEEGRSTIANTEGGIAVLAEILDTGSIKEKEHAAATLLLLCTNSLHHTQLVLREGVIPALVSLSVGNNPRAQDKAQKLLQHFREQRQKETVFSHSAPLSMSLSMGTVGGATSEAEPQQESPSPKNADASPRKEEKKKFGKSRSGSLGFIWKAKAQLPLYQC
ncbi:hypothetical protein M758_2G184400 [Ceratodon purpureus]|nr:hypothetical protein M758_2G184400 [Ceratodon purpureus]